VTVRVLKSYASNTYAVLPLSGPRRGLARFGCVNVAAYGI